MTRNEELENLYGPAAKDLPAVTELIQSVASQPELEFLRQMLSAALAGTGKLLRPAISLLSARLGEYELSLAAPLAASVELLHTATLVHDDVIDQADQRRGKPTPNALFGNSASVMLGDYMFANAADFIAQTDKPVVVRKFAKTIMEMAQGELVQDSHVFEYSDDINRYLNQIRGKTAVLFATAAEGGAIVCDADPNIISAMRGYGMNLGMAFQVVDDILDFTGDASLMGKPIGSDLMSGNITLPAILYMQKNPSNPIQHAFEGVRRTSNIKKAIKEILADDSIFWEAKNIAREMCDEARESIDDLPESTEKKILLNLVEYTFSREH
tara:strand:- start:235 stop:1215 length:981 start_codon:yes stop_codon:yes gene_type:complete